MNKWSMIIDVAKCENCNNCLLACKDEHVGNNWPGYTMPQQRHGDHWIRLQKKERGTFPLIDVAYRPISCMHCDAPPCAAVVPGAITKRSDGIVIINQEKAKGHKELLKACPYGAIQWNEELQVPQKCTLCAHLLDDGWRQPRCVQACPTGALSVVHTTDQELSQIASSKKLQALMPELQTKPRTRYANMFRFNSHLITGTVATSIGKQQECIKGAVVKLHEGETVLDMTKTDAFGDFRFDGLTLNSRVLFVDVIAAGHSRTSIQIENAHESKNLGLIVLKDIACDRR